MGEVGKISPDFESQLPIWRIVIEGKQSLVEVETWDLPMIAAANDLLDMRDDMTAVTQQIANDKGTD